MVGIKMLCLAFALVAPALAAPVADTENDKRFLQYNYVPSGPGDAEAAKKDKRFLQYNYVPSGPGDAETAKKDKRFLQYNYVPSGPGDAEAAKE